MRYVVVGTSPFVDTSVATGPYTSPERALQAATELDHLGYNTEVVPLHRVADLDPVTNDEGAEA